MSEDDQAKSTALKDEGNAFLKEFKYTEAIDKYTEAIEIFPTAVLFSNRAMAHIKKENFGLAVIDAEKAIEIDSSYVKAYYRRATANMTLAKFKEAKNDFKHVCKLKPKDRDARLKLKNCEKEIKRIAFEEAIQSEEEKKQSDVLRETLHDLAVSQTYDGPKLDDVEDINLEWVMAVVERFKNQKLIHKKYVVMVLLKALEIFSNLKSLIRTDIPTFDDGKGHIVVCGDTHGQFYDVLHLFEIQGYPSDTNPYIFNGDYVDRGSFSFEVIFTFLSFKVLYPNSMHMIRGNHETKNMNLMYGFDGEVKHKYDQSVMKLFQEVFNWIPLAACIQNKIFIVHGGLFQDDGVKLEDIENIDRNREPPDGGLMTDILWSDPQPQEGRSASKRGVGKSFGPDVTKKFLEDNNLDLLVRSHEVRQEGYSEEHDGKCITIFSAPNYCDQMGNKGAFIKFEKDLKPQFTQFDAVPHPPIKPMAYASSAGMYGM